MVQFMNLDDDLIGTRSSRNQVEILSDRKADRASHSTDNVADRCSGLPLKVVFGGQESHIYLVCGTYSQH